MLYAVIGHPTFQSRKVLVTRNVTQTFSTGYMYTAVHETKLICTGLIPEAHDRQFEC